MHWHLWFGIRKINANNFYKQRLRLKDNQPVYIKNYRIPHSLKEEMNKKVTKWINDDIVEPSTSEYNSPILLAPFRSYRKEVETCNWLHRCK